MVRVRVMVRVSDMIRDRARVGVRLRDRVWVREFPYCLGTKSF